MDVTMQLVVLAAAYVLAGLVLLSNCAFAFLNYKSSARLKDSAALRARVGSLESSLKEALRRVESLEGSNLSMHRKFNRLKFDGRKGGASSEESETGSDDPLQNLTPAERALFSVGGSGNGV